MVKMNKLRVAQRWSFKGLFSISSSSSSDSEKHCDLIIHAETTPEIKVFGNNSQEDNSVVGRAFGLVSLLTLSLFCVYASKLY